MTTKAATSRRLTRYLAGPALALGLAIGSAGVANAVWDIEAYDDCMEKYHPRSVPLTDGSMRLKVAGSIRRRLKVPRKPLRGSFAEPQLRAHCPRAPTHVMQPLPLPGPGPDIGPAPGEVG